jgi:hypothetical protein
MHADSSPEDLPVQQDRRWFVAENDPADRRGKQDEDRALFKEEFQVLHKLLAKKGRVASVWPVEYGRCDGDTRQQQGVSFRLMDVKSSGVTVHPIIPLGGEHRVREVRLEGVCDGREPGIQGKDGMDTRQVPAGAPRLWQGQVSIGSSSRVPSLTKMLGPVWNFSKTRRAPTPGTVRSIQPIQYI